MSYLGEYSKNSKILLELLTKDELGQPISADTTPTAVIEFFDGNGMQIVSSVILIEISPGRYVESVIIPETWLNGDYYVTYSSVIEGSVQTQRERFAVRPTEASVLRSEQQLLDIKAAIQNLSIPSAPDTGTGGGTGGSGGGSTPTEEYVYIPTQEFQMAATVKVEGNKVIITPSEPLKLNYNYTVVVDKMVKSTSGALVGKTQAFKFSSAYSPLYATPIEVASVLRQLYPLFKAEEIFLAIRDAGQKAHQLQGITADANNTSFRLLDDRETNYFATIKYVTYEAAYNLLNSLMMKVVNMTDGVGGGDDSTISFGDGGFKLGDFEVSGGSTSSGGTTGNSSASKPMTIISTALGSVEKQLKYWMDAMMSRNARGYAKPITAQTRVNGIEAPADRGFD
jgi:hypothetical protein